MLNKSHASNTVIQLLLVFEIKTTSNLRPLYRSYHFKPQVDVSTKTTKSTRKSSAKEKGPTSKKDNNFPKSPLAVISYTPVINVPDINVTADT